MLEASILTIAGLFSAYSAIQLGKIKAKKLRIVAVNLGAGALAGTGVYLFFNPVIYFPLFLTLAIIFRTAIEAYYVTQELKEYNGRTNCSGSDGPTGTDCYDSSNSSMGISTIP